MFSTDPIKLKPGSPCFLLRRRGLRLMQQDRSRFGASSLTLHWPHPVYFTQHRSIRVQAAATDRGSIPIGGRGGRWVEFWKGNSARFRHAPLCVLRWHHRAASRIRMGAAAADRGTAGGRRPRAATAAAGSALAAGVAGGAGDEVGIFNVVFVCRRIRLLLPHTRPT